MAPPQPWFTPPDSFLWDHPKSRFYKNKPVTISQLKTNILQEIAETLRAMFQRVYLNLGARFEECQWDDGGYSDNIIFKK